MSKLTPRQKDVVAKIKAGAEYTEGLYGWHCDDDYVMSRTIKPLLDEGVLVVRHGNWRGAIRKLSIPKVEALAPIEGEKTCG